MGIDQGGWSDPVRRASLGALARPSGGLAMLAMDQRVSLRNIFLDAGLEPTADALDAFRTSVARTLAPHASAILLDPGYVARVASQRPWSDGGPLIVAADDLKQVPGETVHDSGLDPAAAVVARATGAVALKLLVLWYPGEPNDQRIRLVQEFVELAHTNGMLAIVEGIVKGNTLADREHASADEFLTAARALANDADLYKAQVPINAGADASDVERLSMELTAAVPCPWVVLSTGVPPERFDELLASACRGGASGFLAGRAIWRVAIGADEAEAALADHAVRHLEALAAIVDAEARPWDTVPGPVGRDHQG